MLEPRKASIVSRPPFPKWSREWVGSGNETNIRIRTYVPEAEEVRQEAIPDIICAL